MKQLIKEQLAYLRLTGILSLFPVFITCVAVPALTVYVCRQDAAEQVPYDIAQNTQFFLPLFSLWWLSIYLNHIIEENGNELLYYPKKSHIPALLFWVIVYGLLSTCCYGIINHFYPVSDWECIRMWIELLWIDGCFCFLTFCLGSMIWSFGIFMIYLFICIFIAEEKYWFIFISSHPMDVNLFFSKYLIMGMIALVIWYLAYQANKAYETYH